MSSREHSRHPDCPNPERWSAPDREATENEVTEFLGALVYALKPERVLETGCYRGHTTEALGDNVGPYGHVDALDIDGQRITEAQERCKGLPVTFHLADSRTWVPEHDYDFMFFDSGMDVRIEEMRRFAAYATNRCIFAIHDSRGYWIQQALKEMENAGSITRVDLPTPRGITIGRYL